MSTFRRSNRRVKSGSGRRTSPRREFRRRIHCEQLEGRLLMAADLSNPYYNVELPWDVNQDGNVTPLDALNAINFLNQFGQVDLSKFLLASGEGGGEGEAAKLKKVDVNNDGFATSNDALRVINALGEGDSTMTYSLKIFNEAGTQEISSIGVGGKFQLRTFVKDNRVLGNFPNGNPREGVFAAYLDVKYPAALANVSGQIAHNNNEYGQAPSGNTATDGVIDGAGSFRGSLTPLGRNEFLLWSLPMTAEALGTVTFTGEPTTDANDPGDQGQSPSLDTGVYGEDNPICPSVASCTGSMGFTNVSLTVADITDPQAVNDSRTVAEDSGATVINPSVLANDTTETPPLTITAVTQGTNGGTVTFTSTNVTYQPALNFNGTDIFTYTIANANSVTDVGTVTMTVTAVNDAPVITVPGAQTTAEDVALVFNTANSRKISVSDADGDVSVQATITATNGKLSVASAAGVTITGNNTGSLQLTGTVSAINAALDSATGLNYQPNQDFNGSDTLTVTVNDQGNTGGAALSDTETVAITVTAVNDAPVNTVPGNTSTDEDVALTFSTANGNALSVTDADSGSSPLSVTLSIDQAQAGTLNLASTAGVTVTGNGTTSINITGPATAISTALGAGLTFTPASGFITQTPIVFTMRSDDQGATGSGGAKVDTDTFNIDVVPTVRPRAVADSATVAEDNTTGVTINVLANDKPHTGTSATLLSFTQPAAGGVVTLVDNGTPGNNTDDQLKFVPNSNFAGTATFTYTINDTLAANDPNKGADSTATVTVTVSPQNDGPSNTVPGAQNGTEDTPLVINGISVTDIDASTGNIEVTLSVTNGTVNVNAGATTVVGNGTSSAKVTGTLTAVNAALAAGVTYTGNLNFSGSDTLTVATSDLGNTGAPGALTDTDTVAITLAAVNDAPQNTVPGEQSTSKNVDLTITGIQVADVDAGNSNIQVVLSIAAAQAPGTLTVSSAAGVTITGNTTASVTLNGPQAAINTALASGVRYHPATDFTGDVTMTVATSDLGNTGSGGAKTDTDTIAITVEDFRPSTVGGGVFVDVNGDGIRGANELGMAGVLIRLTGQDFFGAAVSVETRTGSDGLFSFTGLKPGTYTLEEVQPAAFIDGDESFGSGFTSAGNDRASITIATPGGITNNTALFGEIGLEAQFIRAGDILLASSDPNLPRNQRILFGSGSGSDWSIFDGWAGYNNARYAIVSRNGVHAVVTLTVHHIATNSDRSVTLNSAIDSRLIIIDNGGETVIRFKGSPDDLFAAAAEGESQMSGGEYSEAVDAVMTEVAMA